MKSVFFNSIGGTSARSSFTAETPAQLIDCYLVLAVVRRPAKFEGRRNRGASAANDGDSDRLLLGQIIFLARSNSDTISRTKNPLHVNRSVRARLDPVQATSNSPAAPMPPPTHIVTTTYLTPRRLPSISACPVIRDPLIP